jgi:biotin carboxyl carrier protein
MADIESPPLCAIPLAGRHCLVRWRTSNGGAHVALVERPDLALLKARSLSVEHRHDPDFALCDLLEIELVSPSEAMRSRAVDLLHEEQVEDFCLEALMQAAEALGLGLELPYPFKCCPPGQPGEEEGDAEDFFCGSVGRFDRFGDVQIDGMTAKEFFDRYHDRWEREAGGGGGEGATSHPSQVVRLPSLARPVREGEELWMVLADFGHNQEGVALQPVKSEEDIPRSLSRRVLFLFVRIEEIDSSALRAEIERANADARETERRDRAAWHEQHERNRRREIETWLRFFRDAPEAAKPESGPPERASRASHSPATPTRPERTGQHDALGYPPRTRTVSMPVGGTVVHMHAFGQGDLVQAGQPVCVVESMKVEMTVLMPEDGRIVGVLAGSGQDLPAAAPLLHYKPSALAPKVE